MVSAEDKSLTFKFEMDHNFIHILFKSLALLSSSNLKSRTFKLLVQSNMKPELSRTKMTPSTATHGEQNRRKGLKFLG